MDIRKKLWVFGDSFSVPFWDSPFPLSESYIGWKGGIPKVYGERVSEELDLKMEHRARGGWDNYSIFQAVCDTINSISEGDVVIIGWTASLRFRLWEGDRWFSHNPQTVSSPLHKGILDNRFENEKEYSEEVGSWMKLIRKALPNNPTIFWVNNPQSLIPAEKVLGVETISEETDGFIRDGHPSEGGHKVLADRFTRLLQNRWI